MSHLTTAIQAVNAPQMMERESLAQPFVCGSWKLSPGQHICRATSMGAWEAVVRSEEVLRRSMFFFYSDEQSRLAGDLGSVSWT